MNELLLKIACALRKEEKIDVALSYLQKCAETNNTRAMFHLGFSYLYYANGWGLKEDLSKAVEWLKKASERGDTAAMAHYAQCLKRGEGVEANGKLAKVWGKKALSSKNSYGAGCCCFLGIGLEKPDYEMAFLILKPLAEEGDEFAQHMLADCYANKISSDINNERMIYWYTAAAEQGLCSSQYMLGILYGRGLVCEKNREKAIFWHQKAANQGNAFSVAELIDYE